MVMPVYIRPVLALFVAAAVIATATVVYRSGSYWSVSVQPTSQELPHNIDVTLKRARFSEIDGGLVIWVLNADRVDYDKTGDTARLFGIRMLFQRDHIQDAVIVTADNGEYSSAEKKIRLTGHVHVVTDDGTDFTTRSITYTGATALFSTKDPVLFRQEKLQLAAVGMDLDVKSRRARFFSEVEASIISQ